MINLLYCGNDAAQKGVLLSLLSIVKYHKNPLNVYFMTMDLTSQNPAYKPISEQNISILDSVLKQANALSKITKIDATIFYNQLLSDNKNSLSRYTPYTFLRLFCHKFDLPDKILYLDYDTIAYQDIKSLWDIDISLYEFAGAKDYYGRFFINPRYINAGVLLFNLDMIKKTGLFDKCLDMVMHKKMLLPDQSALNKKAVKKLIINKRFNEQHKTTPDTVIRHFSMTIKFFPWIKTCNIKPWDKENLHRKLKIYDLDQLLDRYFELLNQSK